MSNSQDPAPPSPTPSPFTPQQITAIEEMVALLIAKVKATPGLLTDYLLPGICVVNFIWAVVITILLLRGGAAPTPPPTPGPAPTPAADIAFVTDTIQANVGEPFDLEVTTDGTGVQFLEPLDAKGKPQINLVAAPGGNVKTAKGWGNIPGTFHVRAVTSLKGNPTKPACAKVTIGTPVPPTPPAPPQPADPFFQTLNTAWQSEPPSPANLSAVASLAALYEQVALTMANDTSLKTLADFNTAEKKALGSVLKSTDIPKTRAALSAEIAKVLPSAPSTALDTATRTLLSSTFTRLAKDLEALK